MKRVLTSTPAFFALIVVFSVVGTLIGARLGGDDVSAEELQAKLAASCQDSRTPLQAYFQGEIAGTLEDVSQSAQTDPALFPDIPLVQFRALIAESIARRFERIGRLEALVTTFDPAACPSQYQ